MANEADILKALENLYGPGGVSLAGAISGVNVTGAKAFVSLAGDPAQCEALGSGARAAERAVKAMPANRHRLS